MLFRLRSLFPAGAPRIRLELRLPTLCDRNVGSHILCCAAAEPERNEFHTTTPLHPLIGFAFRAHAMMFAVDQHLPFGSPEHAIVAERRVACIVLGLVRGAILVNVHPGRAIEKTVTLRLVGALDEFPMVENRIQSLELASVPRALPALLLKPHPLLIRELVPDEARPAVLSFLWWTESTANGEAVGPTPHLQESEHDTDVYLRWRCICTAAEVVLEVLARPFAPPQRVACFLTPVCRQTSSRWVESKQRE